MIQAHSEMPKATRLVVGALLFGFIVLGSGCQPPENKVARLDTDQGIGGFVLGDSLYPSVFERSAYAALDHEVLEFEAFGSRFADDRPVRRPATTFLYGVRISQVRAGLIDDQVYAYLLQLDANEAAQMRFQDSLITHYGVPQAEIDTLIAGGASSMAVHRVSWKGERVGLDYGRGDGFAELLVYDQALRDRRVMIQDRIFESHNVRTEPMETMGAVADVQLDITKNYAQWRYRYRGRLTEAREGTFGDV